MRYYIIEKYMYVSMLMCCAVIGNVCLRINKWAYIILEDYLIIFLFSHSVQKLESLGNWYIALHAIQYIQCMLGMVSISKQRSSVDLIEKLWGKEEESDAKRHNFGPSNLFTEFFQIHRDIFKKHRRIRNETEFNELSSSQFWNLTMQQTSANAIHGWWHNFHAIPNFKINKIL